MDGLIAFLVAAIITALSLLIISRLPIGIEIESWQKALVAGGVFGILDGLVRPILFWLTIPFTILTLGLFLFVLNGIIFALAAKLVKGFALKAGFWSAILGAICLSLVNSVFFQLLDLAS